MNIYKKICSCGVSKEKGFEWLLRISVFMTFVGHGAYGFVHKPGWLPFYEVLGIGPEMAQNLFPLTGIMDVTMGILALVLPIRAPFLFLAFWGTFTAFLRPLAMDLPSALKGQYSWFEVLERAGNYVPAFVAVYLMGIRSKPGIKGFIVGIFEKVPVPTFTIKTANVASWMLRIGTFLLRIGAHGYGARDFGYHRCTFIFCDHPSNYDFNFMGINLENTLPSPLLAGFCKLAWRNCGSQI
jgi:hypothetical protein